MDLSFATAADHFDPAAMDPVAVDSAHPPSMTSLKIASGDAQLNALLYLAGGVGRHPIVVMFHGYPGNEKNLDLAQAIRRAGFHVLWFNYRGSWGSGGTFGMEHALEDARNVLAFVRSPEAVEKYGIDAHRVALVGHSFGGWLALMVGARDARVSAIVSLAAWNAVVDVNLTEGDPKKRAAKIADLDEFDPGSGPLRGPGAAKLYEEITQHRVDYDYFRKASELRTRPLLIVAATRDVDQPLPEYHEPLVKALAAEQRVGLGVVQNDLGRPAFASVGLVHSGEHEPVVAAPRVEVVIYDDDHPFSAHRIALAQKVTQWLTAALPAP